MNARLRTGDILVELGERNAHWRGVDYWRDVVELERLDGSGRRTIFYQDEFAVGARFRFAPRERRPV